MTVTYEYWEDDPNYCPDCGSPREIYCGCYRRFIGGITAMKNKTEWECTDLRCTHFDGDICRHSGETCEPDIYPCGHAELQEDCGYCLEYMFLNRVDGYISAPSNLHKE